VLNVGKKSISAPGRKDVDRQKSSDAVTQSGVILGNRIVPEKQKAGKKARRHYSTSKQKLCKSFSTDRTDLRTLCTFSNSAS